MAEQEKKISGTVWILGAGFILVSLLWVLSIRGIIPLTYTNAGAPSRLIKFLESPRDDMRGVKVNGHLLEIGKRPSLQILKEYDKPMYLMRPYRQVRLITRSLTKAEVLDFCTNVSREDFEGLKAQVESGKDITAAWSGDIEGKNIRMIKATLFSYLVLGFSEKPVFLTQVELAKRVGMKEELILSRIIPIQQKWYDEFTSSPSSHSPYPVKYIPPIQDELVTWLNDQAAFKGMQ